MRVFIDARDLINIFNESIPITPDELAQLFTTKGHQLVLPFSLISELVPTNNNTLVVARRFVKIEEDVPHLFLQQERLADIEIQLAANDFANQRRPSSYDPFVPAFRDLWGETFDPIFRMELDRTIGKRKMSFQIDLAVEQQSEIFHWQSHEGAQIVRTLHSEQTAINKDRPKDRFRSAVARWLARSGIEAAGNGLKHFADFLRRHPRIAPGWRLYMEVFDQLARDKVYKPTINDAWDLTNVMMLPYLDALTLDKNKVDLVQRATRRLHEFDTTIDYPNRTFKRIEELLARLGA